MTTPNPDLWPSPVTHPDEDTWEIALPWKKPPLTLNQRMHWAKKAQITKMLRDSARYLARNRVPELGACDVTLVWHPRDRRRRDADNPFPTLKALADGLVDAGVVADDTPDLMGKDVRIGPVERPARMVLVVRRRSTS